MSHTLMLFCGMCNKTVEVQVKLEDYCRYVQGELIQNCFPYLSDGEREMLITQTCEECFDSLFTEDDL